MPRGLFAGLEIRNAQKGSYKEAVLFVPRSVTFSINSIQQYLDKLAQMRGSGINQSYINGEQQPHEISKKLALSALYNALKPKLV